jgi:hypothetical protein
MMNKELTDLILDIHKGSWKEMSIPLDSAVSFVIHSGQPWIEGDDLGDFSSSKMVEDMDHCCFREPNMWEGKNIGYRDYEFNEAHFLNFCISQEDLKLKIEEYVLVNL